MCPARVVIRGEVDGEVGIREAGERGSDGTRGILQGQVPDVQCVRRKPGAG